MRPDYEVSHSLPSSIHADTSGSFPWGGEQRIVTRTLPEGKRIPLKGGLFAVGHNIYAKVNCTGGPFYEVFGSLDDEVIDVDKD